MIHDFPDITETATRHTCPYDLPPAEALVQIRIGQILEATPLELGLGDDDLRVLDAIRCAVEAAYKLGLRDGKVTLGELL